MKLSLIITTFTLCAAATVLPASSAFATTTCGFVGPSTAPTIYPSEGGGGYPWSPVGFTVSCTGSAWFANVQLQERVTGTSGWTSEGASVVGSDRIPSGSGTIASGTSGNFSQTSGPQNPDGTYGGTSWYVSGCGHDYRAFITFKDASKTTISTTHSDIVTPC